MKGIIAIYETMILCEYLSNLLPSCLRDLDRRRRRHHTQPRTLIHQPRPGLSWPKCSIRSHRTFSTSTNISYKLTQKHTDLFARWRRCQALCTIALAMGMGSRSQWRLLMLNRLTSLTDSLRSIFESRSPSKSKELFAVMERRTWTYSMDLSRGLRMHALLAMCGTK